MVFSEVVNFSICRKPVVNIHLDKHNNSGQPGRRILERTPQQYQPTSTSSPGSQGKAPWGRGWAYVAGGFGVFFISGS